MHTSGQGRVIGVTVAIIPMVSIVVVQSLGAETGAGHRAVNLK